MEGSGCGQKSTASRRPSKKPPRCPHRELQGSNARTASLSLSSLFPRPQSHDRVHIPQLSLSLSLRWTSPDQLWRRSHRVATSLVRRAWFLPCDRWLTAAGHSQCPTFSFHSSPVYLPLATMLRRPRRSPSQVSPDFDNKSRSSTRAPSRADPAQERTRSGRGSQRCLWKRRGQSWSVETPRERRRRSSLPNNNTLRLPTTRRSRPLVPPPSPDLSHPDSTSLNRLQGSRPPSSSRPHPHQTPNPIPTSPTSPWTTMASLFVLFPPIWTVRSSKPTPL